MKAAATGALCAVLTLVGCSGSGDSSGQSAQTHNEISYGTPAVEIAKTLDICDHPKKVDKAARCTFDDGTMIVVNSIDGAADQQIAASADADIPFCQLVAHGFEVVARSYADLKSYGGVNRLVADYGGTVVGDAC